MTINFQVLGEIGRDNVLYATVDTGQTINRFLFDCGEGCLFPALSISDIQSIDQLLFSHFHMDHISGFDTYFRINYARIARENHIWGPRNTSKVMGHRFQGFGWNLYHDLDSEWFVHDIHPEKVETSCFKGREAFAKKYPLESKLSDKTIIDTENYSIEAYTMNHKTESMAYILREKPRLNIDTSQLSALGLQGGSWLRDIKDMNISDEAIIQIKEKSHTIGNLRQALLVGTKGQSLAYLSDFLLDDEANNLLGEALENCTYMICESQYLHEDIELAKKNFHMTSQQVALLAKTADVENLILFHVSDRYDKNGLRQLLKEAQAIFPNTSFPEQWSLDL